MNWLIDLSRIWKRAFEKIQNMKMNEKDLMTMNGNDEMKLKLQIKCTLRDNWNTYDPLGEVVFFAAGPFFKRPVFLAPAFDIRKLRQTGDGKSPEKTREATDR